MGKMKKIIGSFLHAPERFDVLAERIADTNELIDRLAGQIGQRQREWFDQLCNDREMLSRLNRGLSISPTVWGDPSRLEIDETAKVFTCFFNTNSGRIRIGEAVFAGSGVSILAGSHDPQLTGYLRRDAEMTEGCDIEVGKGVWLASRCTLLGPCRIGENAVIAAGAVVVPGTEVPAGTVWGGIPAKQIGTLDLAEMSPDNPSVKAAFERSEGILFADGWGERIGGLVGAPGHWLCKEEAGLMTDRADWTLIYRREGVGVSRLRLSGPLGEITLDLKETEGEEQIRLPIPEGEFSAVRLVQEKGGKVFIALMPAVKPLTEAAETEAGDASVQAELDIEVIMEEIRAEARKHGPCDDIPMFDQIPAEAEATVAYLKRKVADLTKDYEIPLSFKDPSRNPLKRLIKKAAVKAAGCATVPLSQKVTETNRNLKTALEEAVDVMEKQQKQIDELTKKVRRLDR